MSYGVLFQSCDWTESENVNLDKICDENFVFMLGWRKPMLNNFENGE
jgi:hypothetical protein